VLAVDFGAATGDDEADADGRHGVGVRLGEIFRHDSPDLGLTFWLEARR
jgi:hypothetical protein